MEYEPEDLVLYIFTLPETIGKKDLDVYSTFKAPSKFR